MHFTRAAGYTLHIGACNSPPLYIVASFGTEILYHHIEILTYVKQLYPRRIYRVTQHNTMAQFGVELFCGDAEALNFAAVPTVLGCDGCNKCHDSDCCRACALRMATTTLRKLVVAVRSFQFLVVLLSCQKTNC